MVVLNSAPQGIRSKRGFRACAVKKGIHNRHHRQLYKRNRDLVPSNGNKLGNQETVANENESKNAKPLEKWVSEQTRNKDMRKFMEDHLIPDTDLSLSNFSDFIEKRKAMLVQRIRKMIN